MKKLLSMFAVLGLMASFAVANDEHKAEGHEGEATEQHDAHAAKKKAVAGAKARKAKKAAAEAEGEHHAEKTDEAHH